MGMPPQVSLAVAVKNTAVGTLEVITMLDGQEIDTKQLGLTTVTVKLQFVVLPQVSLAVLVTVVVPMGKVLPLGGKVLTKGGGLQPPVAMTV